MCNEVILSYKILNTHILFTVNFWGFFLFTVAETQYNQKGFFLSMFQVIVVWDLQLIHDKALVCCCWSFHQKYYLKKRVFIIRIVIIIRHWKKNTGKNLCWIVIVSQWEWVITTAHVKLFLNFILYRRYCKNRGICGWSTELTWWNYVLHPMETWSWQ